MKQIQRNGLKFKIFEEEELRHCFNMSEKDIGIILDYQDKFPELMLEDGQGFCIDARRLFKLLKLDNTKTKFADWIKKNLENIDSIEEEDFIRFKTKNPKGGRPTEEFKLTLELAKELCMAIGITPALNKETKELSKLCRKYFITIEKTLKNYEKWNEVREPEKLQANLLKDSIRRYCERNGGFDDTRYKTMKCKEFNLINSCLTGYEAIDIDIQQLASKLCL